MVAVLHRELVVPPLRGALVLLILRSFSHCCVAWLLLHRPVLLVLLHSLLVRDHLLLLPQVYHLGFLTLVLPFI